MSADFIEDGMQSLMASPDTRCVAIAWLRDSQSVHRCAHLKNREQIEYARAKLNELLDEMYDRIPPEE